MKHGTKVVACLAVMVVSLFTLAGCAYKVSDELVTVDNVLAVGHMRRANGTTFTTADPNPTKAQLQANDFFLVDTSTNVVDLDFANDAALDSADIGSVWKFIVSAGGTNALTVSTGASGVTTVTTNQAGAGASCEDVGDSIECTAYATTKIQCLTYCAD